MTCPYCGATIRILDDARQPRLPVCACGFDPSTDPAFLDRVTTGALAALAPGDNIPLARAPFEDIRRAPSPLRLYCR